MAVSRQIGIDVDEFNAKVGAFGRRRPANIWCRQVAAHVIRKHYPHWALKDVAVALNYRGHASAFEMFRQAEDMAVHNPDFREDVRAVMEDLGS